MAFLSQYGKQCAGTDIDIFQTLEAAKAACYANIECGCIYDRRCDGAPWHINKGSALTSSREVYHSDKTCAWKLSK